METVLALVLLPGMMPWVVHADPSSGAYNFAVGGGDVSCAGYCAGGNQTFHLAFSAHCQVVGPVPCDQTSATPPTGHVVIKGVYSQTVSGPVTCLQVILNHAYITFHDTTKGEDYFFSVVDNGPPVNGQPVDLASLPQSGVDIYGPDSCSESLLHDYYDEPLTSGNIVVNQGAILPCTPVTDNTTFMVDTSCNLYTNTGTATSPTWILVQ